MSLSSGRARNAAPWELTGLQLYNERESGEGEKSSLVFLQETFMSPSSVPPPERAGKLTCPSLCGQARTIIALWKNISRSQYKEGLSF